MQSDLKDCAIGSTFEGRFVIERELGRGGMGTVYRAMHLQLQKAIALKVLQGVVMGDPVLRQRFVREIKSASALDHPNIVKILASDLTEDGRAWVAMDLIDGDSLANVIQREGTLCGERAKNILMEIASGLSYAHEHNIIHRDIKPANVMIVRQADDRERALIVDFGLAKEVRELPPGQQSQTATTMQGSPLYMSPEQCEQRHTDPRTDVYAFGCLMHEMFTGKAPFECENVYSIMYKHIHEPVPPLPAGSAVPANLESIMFKCLQKDPRQRFQNGAQLLEVLQSGVTVTQKLTRAKEAKKRRALNAGAVIGALLFAILVCLLGRSFVMEDENRARKFCSLLDAMHFYEAESAMLKEYADRTTANGALPKPDSSVVESMSKDQQELIVRYWRLRIDAVDAALRANPIDGDRQARDLASEMHEYLCLNMSGVPHFISPLYDDMIIEWIEITKMIPTLADRRDEKAITALTDVAEYAASRAVNGAVPWLIEPALDISNLANSLATQPRDRRLVAQALCRLNWRFAFLEKDPQRKKEFIKIAKELVNDQLKYWHKEGHPDTDSYVIGTRAQYAICQYLSGDLDGAEKTLQDSRRAFENSPDRLKSPDPLDWKHFGDMVNADWEAVQDRKFVDEALGRE
jgi:serine/threonine protein kinase